MLLPKNSHSLVVITILAGGLASCYSAPIKSSQQTPIVETTAVNMPDAIEDIEVKDNQVIQWANSYEWQLAKVVDAEGNTIALPTAPPIKIEVTPDIINLKQGCLNYGLEFISITAPPFPYYAFGAPQSQSDCANNEINNMASTDSNTIDMLFPKNSSFNFNLELLAPAKPTMAKQSAPKRLALVIEHNNTLIFQGTPKTLLKPIGLPITNEILEIYQWQLISATTHTFDDKGTLLSKSPIGDFYHPDFPISLGFSNSRDQYVSFYSQCNYGVGGPYALLKDNTLLIGRGSQTVMSCGLNGNRIETTLSKMMTRSKSKLTLSLQPARLASEKQADFTYYNLVQTMETGETLVWQNEPIPEPTPWPWPSVDTVGETPRDIELSPLITE